MRRAQAPSSRLGGPARLGLSGFNPPSSNRSSFNQGHTATFPTNGSLPRPSSSSTLESSQNISAGESNARYFSVVWCKASTRKHKKWEDDALLVVRAKDRLAMLKSLDGKEIGRGSGMQISELEKVGLGGSLSFGGKEIEVIDEIDQNQYQKRIGSSKKDLNESEDSDKRVNISTNTSSKYRPKVLDKSVFKQFSVPKKFGVNFVNPVLSNHTDAPQKKTLPEDAFVLPRPPPNYLINTNIETITDVVVDQVLAKQLRPHQREGVVFLYRCIMGYNSDSYGAILADEMGLGKTLQTITLIWTLLRQGPFGGQPVIKRILILSPSSLVSNWQNEFHKWLGNERIRVYAVDGSNRVSEYIKIPNLPVLIMSYEMFVRSFEDLQRLKFDLIVCDEGHRLKNEKIKVSTLLSQMDTEKRIVLTGTPLQNDLKEFYAIVCAVNPNAFGSAKTFARDFEDVIVRSRQPNATEEEIENGELRLEELNQMSSLFILRRTQDIIKKYLPPKREMVLFCKPSSLQSFMYNELLGGLGNILGMDTSCVLARRVCNHPLLFDEGLENCPPELYEESSLEEQGGKLAVLSLLLHNLRAIGNEKIVLVSISTKVLDLLQELCDHYRYPCLRLDGSTNTNQRQAIVKRFNSPHSTDFVLLLSSKAGGTGLNLIGASRILLYDMDWNPATDMQAMARVWRDGQRKPVTVYRLATAGTIEEKIFQRQITKQGLGGGLVEEGNSNGKLAQFHFSKEELKDLFSFDEDTNCGTHDLLGCECNGNGENNSPAEEDANFASRSCQLGPPEPSKSIGIRDLMQWKHIRPCHGNNSLCDENDCLQGAMPYISYVFMNTQS